MRTSLLKTVICIVAFSAIVFSDCPGDYDVQMGECIKIFGKIYNESDPVKSCNYTIETVHCVVGVSTNCCEMEDVEGLLNNMPLADMTTACSDETYVNPCV